MSHALAGGNFLIPNMTFVVELAAFLIVLGVLRRYVIPPVQQAMTARQDIARKLVSDRQEAKRLLEKAQAAYKTAMADARHEAAHLRAQAEGRRSQSWFIRFRNVVAMISTPPTAFGSQREWGVRNLSSSTRWGSECSGSLPMNTIVFVK